jgi:hypothetical protein
MKQTPSGFYYPNKMGRLYLTALEEVLGKNGINAVLHLAEMDQFIDNYPPEDLEKQFDFIYIAALHATLETMYGVRGGGGLEMRAGRVLFSEGLRIYGALYGVEDLAFRNLPLSTKLRIGVPVIAKVFTSLTDQISNSKEYDDHFIYTLERCSMCWKRTSDKPLCHTAVGIIQEALKWVSGGLEFKIEMQSCMACGHAMGELKIHKEPVNPG